MAWSDEARAAAAAARAARAAAAQHPAHTRAVFTLPPKGGSVSLGKLAGNAAKAALGVAAGAAGTFVRGALRNQGGRRR
jgi:hypothetical protein